MTDAQRLAYRIDEAAEAIRVSRVTIYKLIGEGKLKTIKIGRCRLVPASALALLAENGVENVPTNVPRKLAAAGRRRLTLANASELK